MPTCLAVRHVAFEDLGVLVPLLAERGYAVQYREAPLEPFDTDALLRPDLVVVLGGPIGVYESDAYPFLAGEIAAIGARLSACRPTLGICLGAQLIAAALGAQVAPGPTKEIGFAPLTVTPEGEAAGLAAFEETPVLHWHGDNLDLPAGATCLASTAACPVQAFSIGPAVLGLQFHVEVDPAAIETWLVGHTVELGKAGLDPRDLRRQAATHAAATAAAGRTFLAQWLDGIGR
ncbi:glutamine amidotransferase [Rhodoplanes serenus]|uniref:glutamine amidotransferase n=1 Tax=Rhodoplanes serenus TaxID=200615 RepID=UPI000DADE658|nr:glutamine amidotransferase [Rhodoplanes serenus]RAI31688.1 glutamine amidotransferase [Rhodoplanes serenus]